MKNMFDQLTAKAFFPLMRQNSQALEIAEIGIGFFDRNASGRYALVLQYVIADRISSDKRDMSLELPFLMWMMVPFIIYPCLGSRDASWESSAERWLCIADSHL